MEVVSIHGYRAKAPELNYRQQLDEHSRRVDLIGNISTLLTISNPRREEFIESLSKLVNQYL